MEHVLWDLRSQVDVRSSHDLSQWFSKLNLLDSNIEVKINSILKSDIWVVQKSKLSIIWPLPHILKIKLVDSSALSPETFKDIHSGLAVHEAESSHEIKFPIFPLFLTEFLCAEIPSIWKVQSFQIHFLVGFLDLLHHVWRLVRDYQN